MGCLLREKTGLTLQVPLEASTKENSVSLEGNGKSPTEERDNLSNQVNLSNQKTGEGKMMMTCKKVKEGGGGVRGLEQKEMFSYFRIVRSVPRLACHICSKYNEIRIN